MYQKNNNNKSSREQIKSKNNLFLTLKDQKSCGAFFRGFNEAVAPPAVRHTSLIFYKLYIHLHKHLHFQHLNSCFSFSGSEKFLLRLSLTSVSIQRKTRTKTVSAFSKNHITFSYIKQKKKNTDTLMGQSHNRKN